MSVSHVVTNPENQNWNFCIFFQGSTFDKVIFHADNREYKAGSSLVAISRVKKDADIRIICDISQKKRFEKVHALPIVKRQHLENERLKKASDCTMIKIKPVLRDWVIKTEHTMQTWTEKERHALFNT